MEHERKGLEQDFQAGRGGPGQHGWETPWEPECHHGAAGGTNRPGPHARCVTGAVQRQEGCFPKFPGGPLRSGLRRTGSRKWAEGTTASAHPRTPLRPRTATQPPHGWSVQSWTHLVSSQHRRPTAKSAALPERQARTRSAFPPRPRPLSRFFSSLCFSEGLRGWPELAGEEVFPRNGSMPCVWAAAPTGLTFFWVRSGSAFPAGRLEGLAVETEVGAP